MPRRKKGKESKRAQKKRQAKAGRKSRARAEARTRRQAAAEAGGAGTGAAGGGGAAEATAAAEAGIDSRQIMESLGAGRGVSSGGSDKFCVYVPQGKVGRYIKERPGCLPNGLYTDAFANCNVVVLISADKTRASLIHADSDMSEETIKKEVRWLGEDCTKIVVRRPGEDSQEVFEDVFKTPEFAGQFQTKIVRPDILAVAILDGDMRCYKLGQMDGEFNIVAHPLQHITYSLLELNREVHRMSSYLLAELPDDQKPPLDFNPLVFDGMTWCKPGNYELTPWPPVEKIMGYQSKMSSSGLVFDLSQPEEIRRIMGKLWNIINPLSSLSEQQLKYDFKSLYITASIYFMKENSTFARTLIFQFKRAIFDLLLEYQNLYNSGLPVSMYYKNLAIFIGQNSGDSAQSIAKILEVAATDDTAQQNERFMELIHKIGEFVKWYRDSIACSGEETGVSLPYLYAPRPENQKKILATFFMQDMIASTKADEITSGGAAAAETISSSDDDSDDDSAMNAIGPGGGGGGGGGSRHTSRG